MNLKQFEFLEFPPDITPNSACARRAWDKVGRRLNPKDCDANLIHKLHHSNCNRWLNKPKEAGNRFFMTNKNTKILNALSQPNRLALFEAIANAENGLTTTEAAKAAGTLLNTAAVNLTVLEAAGLISSKKSGRSVTHKAKLATVHKLADYLAKIGA